MTVRGVSVTDQTRCVHYDSDLDVVAVRFKCCDTFYACLRCHDALANHPPLRWSKSEREINAIYCGTCQGTMSIREYIGCGNRCPLCGAAFNAGCADHYHFYFEL
jgi:uncharacterized CHY-type Zn-finger protein